jgi:hypothetical protein
MWNWFERSGQRQRDLDRGVDADLVRDNRKKWKLCYWLLGCGFALMGVNAMVHLTGVWDHIAIALTMASVIGGVLVGQLARAESGFLSKPDTKEPPRIWK